MKKLKMNATATLTFEEGCNKYLMYCRQRNLRDGTINHYCQSYTQFYKYFDPDMPVIQIDEKSYNDYVLHLKNTLNNDISINSYLRDLITTLHYLMNEGYMPRFKMKAIKVDESHSFNIKESSAKGAPAKLKTKLSKVLAFIDSIKHLRANEGCTILPISVTNRDNLAIWGSTMSVTRALKYMTEIGLISLENDQYQHHAYYEEDNTSKTYRYYKENEDKVKEYCAARGIEMFITENLVYSMAETKSIRSDIDISKVRFSSRLRLIKPAELSKPEFEK